MYNLILYTTNDQKTSKWDSFLAQKYQKKNLLKIYKISNSTNTQKYQKNKRWINHNVCILNRFVDGACTVNVNMFLRSISKIDDYKMVSCQDLLKKMSAKSNFFCKIFFFVCDKVKFFERQKVKPIFQISKAFVAFLLLFFFNIPPLPLFYH